ncbi:hypothetical protein [uncultured Aureimonas sp.]|uniref:hypothetical protein n=1 Tax=uncultured Aureimonas sp. TaxID=1604662 RepID=UPI0025EA978C|nr:hypothetical protein [uncultured Aureimonas sp.]
MSNQPPKVLQRLRVIDADTPDLETIDPTTLQFDDENRLCVVETVLAIENSAEREAAIEERLRAYRKSYVLLKPSALAAYHAMSDALRGRGDEFARRLGSTRNDLLLMSVRMPDNMWADAFHAALKTLVPFITSSHPDVDPSFTVAIPQSELLARHGVLVPA